MTAPEYNQPLVESMRIAALSKNLDALRGQAISGDMVSSLFRSSRALAQDVMGATPLAASIFAMRFGSVTLTCATFKDIAQLEHADGSITEAPINSPATVSRSMARYLHEQSNPFSERQRRSQLFFEISDRVARAGITTDFLHSISAFGAEIAREVWEDSDMLTPQYFQGVKDRIGVQPHFSMLKGEEYAKFLEETGRWVEGRFSEVIDSALTGRYLIDQEMQD